MAEPINIFPSGDQLIILMDDETRLTAVPTSGTAWLVKKKETPPDPDPDPDPEPGTGGWKHPLGKQTPWTTYNYDCPGGSHCNGAVDFPLGFGTEAQLYAPCDGTVTYAGFEAGGGGNVIIVQPNGSGVGICMAHLNRIDVSVGQQVLGGAQIGLTGWTGTIIPEGPGGAHLHLEVRTNGNQWGAWQPAVAYFASNSVTL